MAQKLIVCKGSRLSVRKAPGSGTRKRRKSSRRKRRSSRRRRRSSRRRR